VNGFDGDYDRDGDDKANQTPRARSLSRVRFNLDDRSDDATRKKENTRSKRSSQHPDNNTDAYSEQRESNDRRRHHHHRDSQQDPRHSRNTKGSSRPRHRSSRHDGADDEADESDTTVDMPARFDRHGNRVYETADSLQQILGSLASKFLSGGDEGKRRRG